jgi:membrane dipeptidase
MLPLVFDAHLDMAWNALEWNRDLMLSVPKIREFESQFQNIIPGECTTSWFELKRGNLGLIIATLLPRMNRKDRVMTFPQQRETCYGMAMGQLAYYRAMARRGVLREVPNARVLNAHVDEWLKSPSAATPIGFILSMEGSTPILAPEQIAEWYAAGLRILGPAHYGPGPYCYGTGSKGGFNADGKRLLQEMQKVGMLLDVTHLADESFFDAMDIYGGPVLASHHNCRSLVDADRQLTDEQIKLIVARGGVIGAAFDNWMIRPGWVIGKSDPATVKMEHVADHIDHVCQLAGNARHCGIGTDLDGGFGKEQSPSDLDTIADVQQMAGILEKRGYSSKDITAIMYGNFVEFFQRAWS